MDPRFLRFYNGELQFLRELGGEFAKEFPKIAGRLGLDEFECADPYVERLLEGFAFLSARVHQRQDAEFPRFTQHLIEIIHPHFLTPIPSMAIVEFQPNLQEGSLADGYVIPRDTILRGNMPRGEQTACEYRTAHPVTLWPIELAAADYFGRNVAAMGLPPQFAKVKAGLRLRLRATAGLTFERLALDALPLFIRGDESRAARIYEQVFSNLVGIIARPAGGRSWFELIDRRQVVRRGFADNEALLPYGPRSFQGFRLLHEYFAFPQRFMFAEIGGLAPAVRRCAANELEIVLLFDRAEPQLENVVDASQFALFSTPAVNLFPRRLDRIHLNYGQAEHHVVPDRTRPMDLEVYALTSVAGYGSEDTKPQEVRAFYALNEKDYGAGGPNLAYYIARREPRVLSTRQRRMGPRSSYVGSELFLTLVDGKEAPYRRDLEQLEMNALCTNRDLPLIMPVGMGSTDFSVEIGGPLESIRCIAGPSRPRPPLAYGPGLQTWRLINHLALDYLSLIDSSEHDGAVVLRELLGLYADPLEVELLKQIESVRSVSCRSIMRRMPLSGPVTYGRGMEVTLTFDEVTFGGYGVFLLGAVLAQFFARYATINSFTETVLRTTDRGEVMRWLPTIGSRQLI